METNKEREIQTNRSVVTKKSPVQSINQSIFIVASVMQPFKESLIVDVSIYCLGTTDRIKMF